MGPRPGRGPALLFCPADRPERYAKAMERSDEVILDLEDAVAASARPAARAAVRGALGTPVRPGPLDASRVVVRINPLGTDDAEADLRMLAATTCRTVLVPKAEDADGLTALDAFDVIALVETVRGLRHVHELAAAPTCVGLMWGADDLTADIDGRASRREDGTLLPHSELLRTTTLLAAAEQGIAAIDGPLLDIGDHAGLAREAGEAARMGYAAKAAIHPDQVPVIRTAFRPSADQVARARGILAASAAAGGGVATFEGRMIDGPLVRQATAILAAAERG